MAARLCVGISGAVVATARGEAWARRVAMSKRVCHCAPCEVSVTRKRLKCAEARRGAPATVLALGSGTLCDDRGSSPRRTLDAKC